MAKKRVGRGIGSGKGGHTVGRGQKGQKTRTKIPILFEGFKIKKSLLKRLPLQRGKSKFKAKKNTIAIKIERLNSFKDGEKIDLVKLVEAKIVSPKDAKLHGVKIVDGGDLSKKLSVSLPTSASAARKVEVAGGKII